MRYGLIAGSGRFRCWRWETARSWVTRPSSSPLRDNAPPVVELLGVSCHWISIAELGKLIDILHKEKITEVLMGARSNTLDF